MSEQKKLVFALATFMAFIAMAVFLPRLISAGSLEPSAAPGPTMKTLDEIPPTWSQIIPSASERFTMLWRSIDGGWILWGALDKETGLVWEKSPDTTARTWYEAKIYCYQKEVGGRKGWRLPTVEELASLVDTTQSNPTLPSGHPFVNVQSSPYWSSTTYATDTSRAWHVGMLSGYVDYSVKGTYSFVWCVRGGQGHDAY